jgi:hypothetical protein
VNRKQFVMRVIPVSLSLAGRFLALLLVVVSGLAVTAATADEVAFDLRIERGRVPANMRLIRVKQNDAVTLRWSSDRPITLHLHGYDIERKVEPGKTVEMTFVARATGRFPVGVHSPKQGGGHTHEAPVVQVEVYPR